MKKTLLSIMLAVSAVGTAQITTSSSYTAEQMVYKININAATSTIDFSSLSKGIYIIKIVNGEKEQTFKIAKQ